LTVTQDLQALPKYEACARLLIDGLPGRPFSLRTSAPTQRSEPRRSEIIRRASRRRYGRPLAEVSRQIADVFAQ
jgi:hypothetical protein